MCVHTVAAMEVRIWNILCKWQVLMEGAKVNDWDSWNTPSLRENLGSLWLHLKLIGGPAWPLSSKLSRADAESIGLKPQ